MPAYRPPHARAAGYVPSLSPPPAYSEKDITEKLSLTPRKQGTLRDSKIDGKLSVIFIFHGANPKWSDDPPRIFCHTNIDLLDNLDEGKEYAVFEERPKGQRFSSERAPFLYSGWYRVHSVIIHEPKTEGLKELLIEKWGDKPRDGERWIESMNQKWADVTLQKIAARNDNPMKAAASVEA